MTSSNSMNSFDNILSACNRTELHQILAQAGIRVDGALSIDTMLAVLNGDAPPTHPPLDNWRRMIMYFLLDRWAQVSSQLGCPAKSGNTEACFSCTDAQVAHCLIDNKDVLPLIRRYETMITTHNIDNVTTDPAVLAPMGIVIHRILAEQLEKQGIRLYQNDLEKIAWFTTQTDEAKAAALSRGILQYRERNGGAPQAPSAPIAPRPIPLPTEAPLMPPDPRQPVTTAVTHAHAPQKNTTAKTDFSEVISEIQKLRADVFKQIAEQNQRIEKLHQVTALTLRTQKTVLGLLNVFGQHVLELPPAEIIQIGESVGDKSLCTLQELWAATGEGK